MTAAHRDVRLAVETFIAREIPDGRTKACDLAVEAIDDGVRITGTVSTAGIATRLFDHVREFPAVDLDASSVSILAETARQATVSTTAAPVMSAPDTDAEQVTKVLYGDDLTVYDTSGDWRRVTAPDGYLGWVAAEAIAPVDVERAEEVLCTNIDQDAVVDEASVDDRVPAFFPIGTPCQVRESPDETVRVTFRTGVSATVPATAISRPDGLPTGAEIVDTARKFAGTAYEWGGMTTDGIDCSGLVWASYRVFGIELPRDADQQRLVGEAVSRDSLRPGDLLFFPGHVAISLGGARYIHAHGGSEAVVENSLSPEDDEYLEHLDEGLECCRRLLPA